MVYIYIYVNKYVHKIYIYIRIWHTIDDSTWMFSFPFVRPTDKGLLGNQARRLPVTWDSQPFGSAPFEGIKIFITPKSGVGNSFSCLWDWNMLVARRIKGVFHDLNYLQHFDYLSSTQKIQKRILHSQGFPQDSQDYLWFFPPPNKETFLQGFFGCSDRSEQEATVLVGGEFGPWS